MKHFICDVIEDEEPELWFPEIDSPCELSPVGQCEYLILTPDICKHCKRETGA